MEVTFPKNKEKPQIVFITGGPGSGKGTQAAKLVRDHKFVHLSVGDLMRAEAASKTKEGQEIEKIVSTGGLVPDALTVNIILRAIKNRNAKKYLIDGFPRSVEQALLFEKKFKEIDFILNFQAPDEILLERLLKRALTDGRRDDNEESISNRLKIYHNQSTVAINYFARYGKVVNVNADGSEDEVYKRTLQALAPNLLFLYGPPHCGQEYLGECLERFLGYKLIKVKEYFKNNGLANATDEVKMDHLISFLRDNPWRNFILYEFPENIRQVKIFVEHFTAPRKLYYFDYSRDLFESKLYDCNKEQKQKLFQEYDIYAKNRKDILKYFTGKPYFARVKEEENFNFLYKNLVTFLAPEVIACPDVPKDYYAQNYINRLVGERGYIYLDVEQLVKDEITRETEYGNLLKNVGDSGFQADGLRTELITKCLFNNPDRRKFILGGFPKFASTLNSFQEYSALDVKAVIAFTKEPIQNKEDSIYNYCHVKGNLIKVNNEQLDQFDDYVENRCRYGFLIGSESAGRPAIATYLKGKFATQLVNWEQTNEYLKQKLSTEENTVEEVPFPELVKHFKEEIASKDRTHNILFDNWPFEREQLGVFLRAVGAPSYVLWLNASEETLGKRWMIENKAEAVDEGEQEKINEEVAKTRQLVQVVQEFLAEKEQGTVNLFDIKVGISNESTLKDIDSIIFKKVFILRLLISYKQQLKDWIVNLCINKDITFIDVPGLIAENRYNKDDLAKKLNSQIIMTPSYQYKEISPADLTPALVTELINKRLKSYPSSKYVMLYQYPGYDTAEDDEIYPRSLDQLHQVEVDVGPVKQVIAVSYDPEDFTINDPIEEKPVQEVVEVVKPVRAEGEEGEEEPIEEPPKEEEELDENGEPKKKFNPLEFNWSISNGIPKKLGQIFNRRFKTEYQAYEACSDIDSILSNSIKLFDEGEDHGRDFYLFVKNT